MKVFLMDKIEKRPFGKLRRGAGLVEYALVLALIALGTIVILGLSGVSIQRIYGIVGGFLGVKQTTGVGGTSGQVLNIASGDCLVVPVGSCYGAIDPLNPCPPNPGPYTGSGHTGYYLKINTNVAVDQLNAVGTESTLIGAIDES